MIVVLHRSPTVRSVVLESCRRLGVNAAGVETESAARELIASNNVRAVVLDGSTGEALLCELRSASRTATVPVVWVGAAPRPRGEDEIAAEPDVVLAVDELNLRLEGELRARLFADEPEASSAALPSDGPRRVLVIDDSLTYRMQLHRVLTGAGYSVEMAATGEEGLDAAFREGFAAVIVDSMLPRMQGEAVVRRLRSESATRRVPCLLLTASEDPNSELTALEAGADSFVRKDEPMETILLRLVALVRSSSEPTAFHLPSSNARRVLLVGDHIPEVATLRQELLTDGIVVVQEKTAANVLARVKDGGLDCVLLCLPHRQSLEVSRRIKSSPLPAQIRVLLMECVETEPSSLGERQAEALQAGADDYLSSMLPVKTTRARLETQMRRKQMEDENRALHSVLLRQQMEAESQRRLAAERAVHAEEMREAKEAVEQEAQQAETARLQLEQVLEALPQMVLMATRGGRLLAHNKRWVQYTGAVPADNTTVLWRATMHPEDVERYLPERASAIERSIGFSGEFRLRGADGEYRWFYMQIIPTEIDSSHLQSPESPWLATCTDIHDRKLGEEALRRTEKLAATGRLAASIAHEINNPLEAVTNLLYLIEHATGGDEVTHSYVISAQQEIGRVSEIAKKTLTFYRESRGAAPVEMSALVEETRDVYASRLRQKRVQLELEIHPSPRPFGLSGEIRQVVSNLVANAIDASPENATVVLRLRPSRHAKTGREGVRLSVWDRGAGIPVRIRADLFKPFITTKGAGGTGLGLWVAESIAARHQGELRFWTSTLPASHGTCFCFFLPLDGKVTTENDSIGAMMKQIGSELLGQ